MSNEIDEVTLKEPDAIEKILLALVEKTKANLKPILSIVGAGFLVLGAFQALKYNQSRKNATASDAFVKVLEFFPSNDSLDKPATEGDKSYATFITKADDFIRTYADTPISGLALLYKAKALVEEDKLPEAAMAYQDAAAKVSPAFKPLALEGQATVAMNQQQFPVAEGLWKNLSEDANNPLQELHTFQLALCYEAQSKKAEAQKVYEGFEKRFPKSEMLSKVKLKLASLS